MNDYRTQPDGTYRRWPAGMEYLCVECPTCGAPRGSVCRKTWADNNTPVGPACHRKRRASLRDNVIWRPS